MKKIGFCSFFIFSGIMFLFSQAISSQAIAVPQTTTTKKTEILQQIKIREDSRGFEALRNIGRTVAGTNSDLARTTAIENIRNIYRNPTQKEFKLNPNKSNVLKISDSQ